NLKAAFLFMHGGGWAADSVRGTASLWFLPFLQLGWVVFNVGYRSSIAPAAPITAAFRKLRREFFSRSSCSDDEVLPGSAAAPSPRPPARRSPIAFTAR